MGILREVWLFLTKKPLIEAPVYDTPRDAPKNSPYRLPNDPNYVMRVNQDWPEGIGAYLIPNVGPNRYGVPVTGTSQKEAALNLVSMMYGTEQRVELIRDPLNKHDPNAIKVIGYWIDSEGKQQEGQIGWVPAHITKMIAESYPDGPLGARINRFYQLVRGRNPGIRIDIGRPRKARKKAQT